MNRKQILIRIGVTEWEALKERAVAQDRSVPGLVLHLARQYLRGEPWN